MGWFDDMGCLTEAGLKALQEAPAGRAPAEIASHVSRCSRCQRRLLSIDPLARAGRREPKEHAPFRGLLWLGVFVILAFAALHVLLRNDLL